MIELKLRLPRGRNNIVWVPRQLSESFGRDLRILMGGMAAVLYPVTADTNEIIVSTRLLVKELELKASHEAKQMKQMRNS